MLLDRGSTTEAPRAPNLPYAFLPALARGSRGRMTQCVQDALRAAIVKLAFRPGEFIHKDAICTRLGVSRFPVSEALGRLADEGLVEILPQRGTRVSRIDIADCRQAMFIRRAIEGEAMGVIAPRVDDRLLARIADNMLEQERAARQADGVMFSRQDHAFHDILLSDLGHQRVKAVLQAARGNLDRTRLFLLRTPRRQAESYLDHVAIVEALKARDPEAARRAMHRHLDQIMNEVEARAAENPEIFAPSA
jgi:DNA-binding GntR family transcriptional regulator